jgi:hypothetical protein
MYNYAIHIMVNKEPKMKRITLILTLICFAAMFALPASGALFTDFEGFDSFEQAGNPVYNFDEPGDYWVGAWDSGSDNGCVITAEIVDGKGYGGSKALALSEDGNSNVGTYIFATDKNKIRTNHAGANYLRVWCDFTGMGFRKANFGVADSNGCLFTTDEVDGAWECEFYYLAEGSDEWVTMTHGDDGCFGDAQDSDVYGFKGWFAFPLKDFTIRSNANWEALDPDTPCDPSDIAGVYLFWDYSDITTDIGSVFYIDHIEFVEDYKSPLPGAEPAEDTAAEEPEVVPEQELATPDAPAADTAAAAAAPQTADAIAWAATVALLSGGGAALLKKRR